MERSSQPRWRADDIRGYDVPLVLPAIAGFEPTGLWFNSAGIVVTLSGTGGQVEVELLTGTASHERYCG